MHGLVHGMVPDLTIGGGMDGDAGEVVITLESRCLPGVGGGVFSIRTQPNR